MPIRRRLYIALIAVLISFILSFLYEIIAHEPINDLFFPICGARALLSNLDPYGGACLIIWKGYVFPPNPLTTILIAVPFSYLGLVGALLLWSTLTGILVFGLLKDSQYWRLITLLSAPYWHAFLTRQWSPLILGLAFLPSLLPLALVKPQIGFPVIMTNLTRKRLVACFIFLAITFLIDPTWPLRWYPQIKTYDGYIPLLTIPFGIFLAFLIFRWKDIKPRFLLLMSIVPQRGLYDLLPLWYLPQTKYQMILLTIFSWILHALTNWFNTRLSFPLLSVIVIYLPLSLLYLIPLNWRLWIKNKVQPIKLLGK